LLARRFWVPPHEAGDEQHRRREAEGEHDDTAGQPERVGVVDGHEPVQDRVAPSIELRVVDRQHGAAVPIDEHVRPRKPVQRRALLPDLQIVCCARVVGTLTRTTVDSGKLTGAVASTVFDRQPTEAVGRSRLHGRLGRFQGQEHVQHAAEVRRHTD